MKSVVPSAPEHWSVEIQCQLRSVDGLGSPCSCQSTSATLSPIRELIYLYQSHNIHEWRLAGKGGDFITKDSKVLWAPLLYFQLAPWTSPERYCTVQYLVFNWKRTAGPSSFSRSVLRADVQLRPVNVAPHLVYRHRPLKGHTAGIYCI